MNQVLLFTSLKGGVGKTTAASSLAFALSFYGKRVLCVDLDLGVRGLDLALGAETVCGADVLEVITKEKDPAEEAVCISDNLWFLPAPALRNTRVSAQIRRDALDRFLCRCSTCFDVTILDLPAGGGEWFLPLSKSPEITGAVVVTTADPIALRAAEQTGYEIRRCGCRSVRLIVNRCPLKRRFLERGLFDMANAAAIPVLGIVPEDPLAPLAVDTGLPLSRLPDSAAGRAFWNIAVRLCGENTPLLDGVLKRRKVEKLYHIKMKGTEASWKS